MFEICSVIGRKDTYLFGICKTVYFAECRNFNVTMHDGDTLSIEPNTSIRRTTLGQCFANCFDFTGCSAIGFDTTGRSCNIYTGFTNESLLTVHDPSMTIFLFDCDGTSLTVLFLVNLVFFIIVNSSNKHI